MLILVEEVFLVLFNNEGGLAEALRFKNVILYYYYIIEFFESLFLD